MFNEKMLNMKSLLEIIATKTLNSRVYNYFYGNDCTLFIT